MKQIRFFFIILAGITILLLSSCTTSQTFIVQGTPGTVIADHQNRQLAVVDQTGQAQVTPAERLHGSGIYQGRPVLVSGRV